MHDPPPYFLVGTGSNHGWGMYATDIEPADVSSMDEVTADCFAGQVGRVAVNHVLVLHRGNAERRFVRVDAAAWVLGASAPGEIVELETLLIEVRRFDGTGWSVVARWDGTEWM